MPWVNHYAWNTTNNWSITSWYFYCVTLTLSSHFENSLSLIIIRSLNLSNFTTFKRRSKSESLWIYRIEKTLRLYSSHKNSQDMKSKHIWKQKLRGRAKQWKWFSCLILGWGLWEAVHFFLICLGCSQQVQERRGRRKEGLWIHPIRYYSRIWRG